MDKHKQISIKINGKEPKVKKEQSEKPEIVETEKPSIYVENEEIAAAQEEEEDQFSWVLPDETMKSHSSKANEIPVIPIEDLRHTKPKGSSKFPYKPKARLSNGFKLFTLKQLALSIVLAIVLGSGFGLMILKVVKDVNAGPNNSEIPTQPTTNNNGTPPAGNQEDTPANSKAPVELETLSTSIIQGGKFTNADSANTTVSEIKAKGFAATSVKLEGAYFVIAGIGAEQGSIGGLKSQYQEAFSEFFAKTIEVPGGSYSNAAQGDSEVIKASLPIFKELLALSSEGFSTDTIDKGRLENLSKQITSLNELKTDNLHAELKEFQTEVGTAFTHLQAFSTGGDTKSLWQSQQSLLNAFQSYTIWISEIQ